MSRLPIASVVGCNALEAADGNGFFIHPPAPAGRLAGPVADAAQDAGKDVAFTVDHVGIVETALGDQSYVFGNISMGRAAPLAIDDLMEIVGIRSICALHAPSCPTVDFAQA